MYPGKEPPDIHLLTFLVNCNIVGEKCTQTTYQYHLLDFSIYKCNDFLSVQYTICIKILTNESAIMLMVNDIKLTVTAAYEKYKLYSHVCRQNFFPGFIATILEKSKINNL